MICVIKILAKETVIFIQLDKIHLWDLAVFGRLTYPHAARVNGRTSFLILS